MRTKDIVQDWQPIVESKSAPVKKNRQETDQMIPSRNGVGQSEKPGKTVLPLFAETLFKAREFDPL